MRNLALTMGDPAGVGPEITVAAWRALRESGPAFTVLADPGLFAGQVPLGDADAPFAEALPIQPVPLAAPVRPGTPDVANAPAVIESIRAGVARVVEGVAPALVTNPIAKSVLRAAGFPHPGHTEFLGALTGAAGAEVMMLAAPALRVVPVSVHVSLRAALDSLAPGPILRVARVVAAALRRDFGISTPRLAVAGINPHAGEGGLMGQEEQTVIAPAIAALRAEGIDATGPWPPDTMFTAAARARYDAAICHYHDQALIPLKTLDMWNGVNVTLGLSIVRTSPDHGTGFDIAGQGRANPASLIAALRLAADMARARGAA